MDQAQMKRRCKTAALAGTGVLNGFRFILNERGVATIISDPGSLVCGTLWTITGTDEESLDKFEGVKSGFYRKAKVNVKRLPGNEPVEALSYLATNSQPGQSRPGYMNRVSRAAVQAHLPQAYLQELGQWIIPEGTTASSSTSLDGGLLLSQAAKRLGIDLGQLVAQTAIWSNPEAHKLILQETGEAALYPRTRRYKAMNGERPGQAADGVVLDSNNYANHAAKVVLDIPRKQITGFEVCHIWPKTAYEPSCHTALPNLVLLPRGLAGLSDHDPHIASILQYRSFDLYGWMPSGFRKPHLPPAYPKAWLTPRPLVQRAKRLLMRLSSPVERKERNSTQKSNERDRTQYLFMGKLYGKRRLVLAVVQEYQRTHPSIGWQEFRSAFPDELQVGYGKVYGVVAHEAEARAQGEKRLLSTARRRNLNSTDGSPIAVCGEWGLLEHRPFYFTCAWFWFRHSAYRIETLSIFGSG